MAGQRDAREVSLAFGHRFIFRDRVATGGTADGLVVEGDTRKLVAFVVGTALGGKAGESEKDRGDSILETVLGGALPPPPEAVPSEFAEYVRRPPDPRDDFRRGGRMG
jgi:hypothetical protein